MKAVLVYVSSKQKDIEEFYGLNEKCLDRLGEPFFRDSKGDLVLAEKLFLNLYSNYFKKKLNFFILLFIN
jgi:hypothetical protein